MKALYYYLVMPKEQKEKVVQENKKEIIWKAAEYHFVEKGVSWYWVTAIIAAALVLIAIWQKNFFFAVFIVFAEAMLLYFGRQRPQIFEFRISGDGVGIGRKIFYKYEDIESFSVVNRPGRLDQLVFKRKVTVNPYVKVPIDSKLLKEAKMVLSARLPEKEYNPLLIEIFSEWFGF